MLKLYTFAYCPYCDRVREAFDDMGIEYEEIFAERGTSELEKVVEMGGKAQVPFLVDEENEVQMYESAKIIDYAREHSASN